MLFRPVCGVYNLRGMVDPRYVGRLTAIVGNTFTFCMFYFPSNITSQFIFLKNDFNVVSVDSICLSISWAF